MKKIISLILVLVISVLALASCAYNYETDDLSQYADFDSAAFLAALQTLVIEDADFGTDEDVRWEKVADAIFSSLAGEVDTEDKKTSGTPGKYDVMYYNYYYTATIDGVEYIFATDKMKEASATKLQLGLTSNKDLKKKIADALAAFEIAEGGAYATDTDKETVVALGNTVVLSYKKAYSKPLAEDPTSSEAVTETVTNVIVTLPATAKGEGETLEFLDNIVGLKVNGDKKTFVVYEDINGDGNIVSEGDGAEKVEYSNVVVNWVVKSDIASNVTVKDTTYNDDNTTTEKKEVADIWGKKHDLKNVELTYVVYPTYYLEVAEELTAELVIRTLLGEDLVAPKDADENGKIDEGEEGTLDVFHDDLYKNGDRVISAIVTDLAKALDDYASKETALEDAQDKYDEAKEAVDKAGDAATEKQKTTLETAEKNLNTAKGEFDTAKADAEKYTTELLGSTKEGDDVKAIADVIVEQYKDLRYENLENTYKNAIKKALAKEVYALAVKYITFKKEDNGWWKLPRQAVSDAYNRIVNNYKYTFYEGTYYDGNSSTADDISNYKKYNGDFNEFLKVDSKALGLKTTATEQDVRNAIGAQAEAAVKETIIVYILADYYEEIGVSVKVNKEDIDAFKSGYNYLILQYSIGTGNVKEEYYMPALQFDKVMNHILEEKKEKDYVEDAEYGKNKVQYTNVSYTFKDDEAVTE